AAYGRAYQIQTSPDGTTWSTVYSTTAGDGGVDDVTLTGTGRYVRVNGTQRATAYGYSLWEFEVYGS
ncbi:discoidin domain-containing protein, partial [Streptosporangium lutulentum]